MVAEGVETKVAYTELARMGCDQAQGHYMSRAVPAAELEHWLSTCGAADKLTAVPLVTGSFNEGHRVPFGNSASDVVRVQVAHGLE